MADKRCRWLVIETKVYFQCRHPLLWHLNVAEEDSTWGNSEALCHGCPCHEPQPSVVKESLTTQPDPTLDTCRWWKDEYGNWCCSCSDTLPDFTPWTGTDPNGCFCPNCGKIITVRVHDKP